MTDEQMTVLESPPTVGWIVHPVLNVPNTAQGSVWAWCRVEMDQPGYSEIHFTRNDGQTPAEQPDGALRLGAPIFQAWC